MKTIDILLKNIILLVLLLEPCSYILAQDTPTQIIQEKLRVYFVASPNNDARPHPVRIIRDSDVFGGHPNMEHAQQLIRAIFGTGELHAPFRETLANALSRTRKPLAIFLYNDIEALEGGVSEMWVNCIRDEHFFSCATVSDNNNYVRIIHYGANQLNNESIAHSKAGIIRLFNHSRGSGGWWDEFPEEDMTEELFDICVPFTTNYEDFRSSVVSNSSEIRRGMISRSNPQHAETVIDRRPQLREIHHSFTLLEVESGQEICLHGVIKRDNRDYVAIIRFETRDVHTFNDEEDNRTDDILYPENVRQDMVRGRLERIVTRMGLTNLPPVGTGESGRLKHMEFLGTLTGYRRAWEIYLNGSGSIGNVRAFGYTEFQRPGLERAVREMQSLERQPQWMKPRIFSQSEYLLRQIDNNIERIEQILLNND